jgi:inosine-uridine nucleoside N-ribohydrolase
VSDRPRVLLDCDPGHDDAVAIALAARHCDVVGITTVNGNVSLDKTTRNALAVCALLGLDVPVHAGLAEPLSGRAVRRAEAVHGTTGLDGATLPEPTAAAASHDGVGYIIETVRAEEGLWLVPTGPLTNIATALRRAPDLVDRVGGISWMGGSATHGNVTAAAEFNAWTDPEAAAIVLSCGVPRLLMAGLHVTEQVRPSAELVERLAASGGAVGAVLAVTHPSLFTSLRCSVVVETAGTHTRGMTLVDQRDLIDQPSPNCEVLMTVDGSAVLELVASALGA